MIYNDEPYFICSRSDYAMHVRSAPRNQLILVAIYSLLIVVYRTP